VIEPWVLVTVAAAAVQTLRLVLQKRLKGLGLSTGGATLSRFLFAAPLAACAAALWLAATGTGVPRPPPAFWGFAAMGGLAQIVATFCTVALFSERSFAVGIAFTKTETVQVAAFSALILAEPVSRAGWLAIAVGVAGVLILSPPPRGAPRGSFGRAVALGLLAGGLYGLSAIGYRGATQAVPLAAPEGRALVALALVTAFQAVTLGLWLAWRSPGEVGRVLRAWRATAWVGVLGVAGSAGWFTAFALQNAAYVRSLGQIELIFGLIASALVFRERILRREMLGMAVLAVSIVLIVRAG
jgi:drug/metabolite transporter (DMT)-like permease